MKNCTPSSSKILYLSDAL